MKTSELTDRALLAWLDEELTNRIQTLAESLNLNYDWYRAGTIERREYIRGLETGTNQERCDFRAFLESLRNNLRLGIRCIDGELPELASHPWREAV